MFSDIEFDEFGNIKPNPWQKRVVEDVARQIRDILNSQVVRKVPDGNKERSN